MDKKNSLIYDMLRTPQQVQEDQYKKIREDALAQQALRDRNTAGQPARVSALAQGFSDLQARQQQALPRRNEQYGKALGGLLGLKNKELGERVSMAGMSPEARESAETQQTLKGMPRRSAEDLFNIADKLDSVGQAQKAEQIRDRARALETSELDKQVKESTITKNKAAAISKPEEALSFSDFIGYDANQIDDIESQSYNKAVSEYSKGKKENETSTDFRLRLLGMLEAKDSKAKEAIKADLVKVSGESNTVLDGFEQTSDIYAQAEKLLDEGVFTGAASGAKLTFDRLIASFPGQTGSEKAANTREFITAIKNVTIKRLKELGTRPTDADLRFMEELQGSTLGYTEAEYRRILDINRKVGKKAYESQRRATKKVIDSIYNGDAEEAAKDGIVMRYPEGYPARSGGKNLVYRGGRFIEVNSDEFKVALQKYKRGSL